MIPLFPWLGAAPRIAVLLGFAASFWQLRHGTWRIPDWLLNCAIVPVFMVYLLQYRSSNAIQPVVSALTVMLAIRLLSKKNVRHHLQIHVLALFCLSASSLFDLNPVFLFFLTLMLFLEAPALVLLTYHDADPGMHLTRRELKRVLMAGVILPLLSLPLLLLLFPIIPRTRMPMWNFGAAPVSRTTGFSEKVEPGSAANQGSIRETVFRAETVQLSPQQNYWRVSVFNHFDGIRWQRVEQGQNTTIKPAQGLIEQTIYLEPGGLRYLPTLDAPVSLDGVRYNSGSDLVYELFRKSGKKIVYKAASNPSGVIAVSGSIRPGIFLELPEKLPPGITRLAQEILRNTRDELQRIDQLDAYFRNTGFRYTTKGMPIGKEPLEQFLFEQKSGNCEFFASGYAVLLRKIGIPARLVGGYLGGEYNRIGGYYLVSEDMAHVWVEAYIKGKGWLRIDPSSFASNAGDVWGVKPHLSALQRIRMAADAIDYYWNRAVVTYDFDRQLEVAQSISRRLQLIQFGGTVGKAGWLLLIPAICCAGWYSWKKRAVLFVTRETRILRRFHRKLSEECGITSVYGSAGVFELAAASGSHAAEEFARIYGTAVYRDRRLSDSEYQSLKELCSRPFC